jgi:hypothetical protein
MPVFSKRIGGSALLPVLAAAFSLGSNAAHANPIVNFYIDVQGATGGPVSFSQMGAATADPEIFNLTESASIYPSGIIETDWEISDWDFNVDDDPGGSSPASLAAIFTVKNKSASNLQFTITIDMDVQPSNATFYGYSGGFTLTTDSSATGTVSTTNAFHPGAAIWTYLVDGSPVATAFPSVSSFSVFSGPKTGAPPTQSAGGFLGGNPGKIAIQMDFDLTPGEILLLNGNFVFIPAPGALALLGLAGLIGRRRRR